MPEHLQACKAELAALVQILGRFSAQNRLELSTEIAVVARIIIRLLHGIYDLKTEIGTRKSPLHKTFSYLITVPAQLGLSEAMYDLAVLDKDGLRTGIEPRLVRESENARAFLRGAFLAAGFISDPQGDFHFELVCPTQELANGLVALMLPLGIPARSLSRRNSWLVYLKGAESIRDFLALVGAHISCLSMDNVLVKKSLRNDINRRTNADMANQAKSIDASMEQIRAIRLLADRQGLSSLPQALQQLAELRLAHPELSLRELGEMASPPLSKSAVYHRVRRIASIASELTAANNTDGKTDDE